MKVIVQDLVITPLLGVGIQFLLASSLKKYIQTRFKRNKLQSKPGVVAKIFISILNDDIKTLYLKRESPNTEQIDTKVRASLQMVKMKTKMRKVFGKHFLKHV